MTLGKCVFQFVRLRRIGDLALVLQHRLASDSLTGFGIFDATLRNQAAFQRATGIAIARPTRVAIARARSAGYR